MAVVLFAVSFSMIVSSIVTAGNGSNKAELRALAVEAALSKADEIRTTEINLVHPTWGPAGTQGETFVVPGLESAVPAGRVRVIIDETVTDTDLGMEFGMPRDLDGNGLATSTNVSATAMALPVIVEVRWGAPGATAETYRLPVVVLRWK